MNETRHGTHVLTGGPANGERGEWSSSSGSPPEWIRHNGGSYHLMYEHPEGNAVYGWVDGAAWGQMKPTRPFSPEEAQALWPADGEWAAPMDNPYLSRTLSLEDIRAVLHPLLRNPDLASVRKIGIRDALFELEKEFR